MKAALADVVGTGAGFVGVGVTTGEGVAFGATGAGGATVVAGTLDTRLVGAVEVTAIEDGLGVGVATGATVGTVGAADPVRREADAGLVAARVPAASDTVWTGVGLLAWGVSPNCDANGNQFASVWQYGANM